MTLELYLFKNGLTQEEFAVQTGLSQSTISRLIKGKFNPSLGLINRVYEATGGAVKPYDFHKHLRTTLAKAAE